MRIENWRPEAGSESEEFPQLAAQAWIERSGFCPQCGTAVPLVAGGGTALGKAGGDSLGELSGAPRRYCPQCQMEIFPRLDPVIIVALRDGQGRLLLAHNRAWEAGRVSCLAGYVEVGESAEMAVVREVEEEVGLHIAPRDLEYLGSQPWPFPRSFMLAFAATLDRLQHPQGLAEPRPDGVEIEWARFYSQDAFEQALTSGEISLPRPASIARRMIEAWRAEGRPEREQ